MAIEDKYLRESTGKNIATEKRYNNISDFAEDLAKYGKKIAINVFVFNPEKTNIKEIDKNKMELIRIRNQAKTQNFKNIVDEFISFYTDVSEGYWEDVDTSREGT